MRSPGFAPRRSWGAGESRGLIAEGPPDLNGWNDESLGGVRKTLRWQWAKDAMLQAFALAHRDSDDPERQVGAILIGPDGRFLSAGVNKRKPGAENAATRDEQFIHAEVIALTAVDQPLPAGCGLAVSHAPCPPCEDFLFGPNSPYRQSIEYLVYPNEVALNYGLRPDKAEMMRSMSSSLELAGVDEMRFNIHQLPELDPQIQANCRRWFNKGLEKAIYEPAQATR